MNHVELMSKISESTGVSITDCEKVLNALENVLDDELSNSTSVSGAFDKIYKLMTFFNKKGGA
ncbi:HU family DNA-binding protein [Virgibacillus sp. NKC19-3]|uniref:HU family DNA-binding protein n=1 Tax=Virgibacillus saliphilus TaxID=2831674 RepID=UPI001C9B23B7|nr:HU family DNA-binding protein [Virgibacillus sp. NKC19-3]MBY7142624.1 HU family DNA-binding protein [Virgibacillus sp. NKC19-3]